MFDVRVEVDQGRVLVNSVWIPVNSETLVLVELDLKTKYADIAASSDCEVYLKTTERSRNIGMKDELTRITLSLPADFVIGGYAVSRYGAQIFCYNKSLRQDEGTIVWESPNPRKPTEAPAD